MIGRAVKALVWEAIKLGKQNGYLELNFGGISEKMSRRNRLLQAKVWGEAADSVCLQESK